MTTIRRPLQNKATVSLRHQESLGGQGSDLEQHQWRILQALGGDLGDQGFCQSEILHRLGDS